MTSSNPSGILNLNLSVTGWQQVQTTLGPGAEEYKVFAQRDGEWWIGWLDNVSGVNAQERSLDELIVSLRIALEDMQTES